MSERTNCPNCAAVVTGGTCEYCGTVLETGPEAEPDGEPAAKGNSWDLGTGALTLDGDGRWAG